jgi:hypothetical protein
LQVRAIKFELHPKSVDSGAGDEFPPGDVEDVGEEGAREGAEGEEEGEEDYGDGNGDFGVVSE